MWSPSKSVDGFAAQLKPGGGAVGVTVFDAAESGPAPTAFTACTLNVYAVPFVTPGDQGGTWSVIPTVVDVWAVAPMYGVTV